MERERNRIRKAATLADVYDALRIKPLAENELEEFYVAALNDLRGGDIVSRLARNLERAHGGAFHKSLLMGHAGVGKSTELTRLIQKVEPKFRAVRLNATLDINQVAFHPFDFVLLMMAEVFEKTVKPKSEGGEGLELSENLLDDIWDWYSSNTETETSRFETGSHAEGGIGVPGDSLWAKTLGIFGRIRGEIKYAGGREEKTIQYRLATLSDLISLANRLLDAATDALRKATGREWLFIWEDFEKPGIPPEKIERLFLTYANVLLELRTHMICTIPVSLGYAKSAELRFQQDVIPDTPIFDKLHQPASAGRSALEAIVSARLSPDLFEADQMTRLIVASGGNLRDLFVLIADAADYAQDAERQRISAADVGKSVNKMRAEYERRLGEDPYDKEKIPYEKKAERLMRIYNRDEDAKIPDAALYSLLRARAVQEFNGERWFGVHPLVVDILYRQGKITAEENGVVSGGTQ